MNYYRMSLLLLWLMFSTFRSGAVNESIVASKAKHSPTKIMIGYVEVANQTLYNIAELMKSDLMFSGQCSVDIQLFHDKPTQADVKKLFPRYALSIFLSETSDSAIEWRIYDTMQARMIEGKAYNKRGKSWRGWAHNIADLIWPLFTGQPPFFSSRLVYCKDVTGKHGKINKEIWIADFNGACPERVVDTPTINIAPRWNHDPSNPLIFYSRYANTNMQLVVVDRNKRHKVASDFDGTNMLPAFSDDGKMIVYCASRGDGECHLYHYEKGVFNRLTYNEGRNVSPTIAGSVVYFCSDFETNKPQIYQYSIETKRTERITDGGYCASPRYSLAADRLMYTKMINSMMQLMLYDPKTKTHTQLTFDPGNKEECSWSPCGNYFVYSVNRGTDKQIVLFNRLTNEKRSITGVDGYYSYPDWSPLYGEFPIFA